MIANARRRGRRGRDGGVVLIVALIVLVAVVAIALTLAREARVEVQVSQRTADELTARAMVDSAVERGIAALRSPDDTPEATLHSAWRDDETSFRAIAIGDPSNPAQTTGKFWLCFGEEDPGDGKELRYGIRDEASKLNVNTATKDQLLQIPGMTDDIADCILDWRDSDEDPRQNGAESSYYNSLTPGYQCKNGPIESLEEMLRIKGIDESVLYGEDRNRNGILDPCEDDGDKSFPPDDANGQLGRGLADYLTVYSMDMNMTLDGKKRLNASSSNPFQIAGRLSQAGMSSKLVQATLQHLTRRNAPPLKSIGDLLDVPGMDEAGFGICIDQLTMTDLPQVPGLVNVNTAAKEVLAGLPGLVDNDVSAIMSYRANAQANLKTPAWLLTVLNNNKKKLQGIIDMVTTRSWQFTIHAAVALDDHPSVIKRVEVVVDRSYLPVRILWRRDLTPLGFPLSGERQPNAAGTDAPP